MVAGHGKVVVVVMAVLLWDKVEAQWRHCACERVEATKRVPDWEYPSLSLSFGWPELGSDRSRRTAAEF